MRNADEENGAQKGKKKKTTTTTTWKLKKTKKHALKQFNTKLVGCKRKHGLVKWQILSLVSQAGTAKSECVS